MKQKLNIKSHPFSISDEEIEGYMDFDKVLEKHRQDSGKSLSPRRILLGLLIVILLSAGVFFLTRENPLYSPSETNPAIDNDSIRSEEDQFPITGGEKKANPDRTQDSDIHGQLDSSDQDQLHDIQAVPEKQDPETIRHTQTDQKLQRDDTDMTDGHSAEDALDFIQAIPEGGMASLYDYFDRELKYPESEAGTGIAGKTLITFTVFQDGSVGDIVIETSLGHSFDKEVMRVFENMPVWIPAQLNNKAVNSKISIPLYFNE